MFAAIDLGSNSFRLHIGSYEGGAIRIIKSARDPIRLAAGLDSEGYLTDQAMQAAWECLTNFRAILNAYSLDAVRVVATNTLRVAKNSAAFLPAAEKAIGYPIEIISGEEEGRLIYMGVASKLALPEERRLVVDIGGGSTEIILGQGSNAQHVESFSIGTVRQALSFFPSGRIDAVSFDAAILSARSYFEDAVMLFGPRHWTQAYGSSGTIRAISEAIAKNGIGDGKLSQTSLHALKQRLVGFGHMQNIDLVGIKSERMVAMVSGLAILLGVMQELGVPSINAVDAGLRMGVLWDLQLRATRCDRREQSVLGFLQRLQSDPGRGERVAKTAASLYAQLKPGFDKYEKYLYWSGLMHEIGFAVSHTSYHKHGAYLVENADLAGFTTREQRTMGALILAQKGNLRKISEMLSDHDFAKAVLALRLAVIFMHARIDDDFGDVRLKMKNKIELECNREWLKRHPTISFWIGKESGAWEEIDTDFVVKTSS